MYMFKSESERESFEFIMESLFSDERRARFRLFAAPGVMSTRFREVYENKDFCYIYVACRRELLVAKEEPHERVGGQSM